MDPLVVLIFSLVLSYIFVVAAVHKWRAMEEFRETLVNYRLLPESFTRLFAIVVPVMEFTAGLALLVPQANRPAALVSGILLLAYMTAMGINLMRGRRSIDCGCGGGDQKQNISEWLILRNAVLLFFAWCVVAAGPGREFGWFDWVVAALATAGICLIYNILNHLLVNRELLKVFTNHG